MKPHRIILIRHGQSEGNNDRSIYSHKPDYALLLTTKGMEQALAAGKHLHDIIGDETIQFYVSPLFRTQQQLSEGEYNKYSVMMELQADFFAGVWAHHAQEMKNILDPGDIDEALNAAQAIGDDKLQQESQGYVVPESFTHGTSKQRMYWFKKGFDTGDMTQGDTFHDPSLK